MSSSNLSTTSRRLIIAALAVAAVATLSDFNPPRTGDGSEYILMSAAMLNHGTPDITAADSKYVGDYPPNSRIPGLIPEQLQASGRPYFQSGKGDWYSWHFWAYSALNVPAMVFTRCVRLPDTYSFVITNLAFALLASLFILGSRGMSSLQKLAFLGFFWLSGTTYYIRWTHAEVFCTSLLCCSFVSTMDRRYLASATFAGIASWQYPPLALFAVLPIAIEALTRIRAGAAATILRRFPLYAAIGLLTLLAPLFWMATFGTFNLISGTGGSSLGCISPSRLISFFFDLNQGMLLGIPFYVFLVPLLMVIAVIHASSRASALGYPVVLLALTVAAAVTCASTLNFNSGCAVVMRYAYVLSMPVGAAIVWLLGACAARARLPVLVATAAQFIIVMAVGVFPREDYLALQLPARVVLRTIPSLCNPDPEIFIERLTHLEGNVGPERRIYGVVRKGHITKALTHSSLAGKNSAAYAALLGYHPAVVPVDRGWQYLNFKAKPAIALADGFYALPVDARFSTRTPVKHDDNTGLFASGWAVEDDKLRWSNGKSSTIVFMAEKESSDVSLCIRGFTFGRQRSTVMLNGTVIYKGVVPAGGFVDLKVARDLLRDELQGYNVLEFAWPDARRPDNGDSRVIAFALESLSLDSAR